MRLSKELTWERFVLDLEMLLVEDPSSLAPLALNLNHILWPEDGQEQSLRTINFMCYELMARCQEKDEEGRLLELLNYFFKEKGFQITPPSTEGWLEDDLLIKTSLQNKKGAPLPITLIFLHLASQLDLPIYLVHLKRHCIVKWVRGGKSNFLDLSAEGLVLTQEQLLEMMNSSRGTSAETCLEILPSKKVFLRYSEELSKLYTQANDLVRLLTTYNTRLVIEPNNLELLAARALLRQKMGFIKEGLQDLKRYFSFVEKDHSPLELQQAFLQMQTAVEMLPVRNEMEFLH